MNRVNVEIFSIYGGFFLLILVGIILALFINDLLRRRMILACNSLLIDHDKISKVALNSETKNYLINNHHHNLYRINEQIEREDGVLKYHLCLGKRAFKFYLKKRNMWSYYVIGVKMD
ncbi:hypothetical protein [Companilactobacillus sp. HBUAS59699]|uniref:hypothetical protein n=1 Tax=Companilactobacillus sp. HBUAS59699 TaxID=3109358 RepID=UPI002FF18757